MAHMEGERERVRLDLRVWFCSSFFFCAEGLDSVTGHSHSVCTRRRVGVSGRVVVCVCVRASLFCRDLSKRHLPVIPVDKRKSAFDESV